MTITDQLKADIQRQIEIIQRCGAHIEFLRGQLCKVCTHRDATYVPDPSGNNDSFWHCQTCDMYFRRDPRPTPTEHGQHYESEARLLRDWAEVLDALRADDDNQRGTAAE